MSDMENPDPDSILLDPDPQLVCNEQNMNTVPSQQAEIGIKLE